MQHRIIVWVVFKPSRVAQWHPLPSIWQLFEGPVNSFFFTQLHKCNLCFSSPFSSHSFYPHRAPIGPMVCQGQVSQWASLHHLSRWCTGHGFSCTTSILTETCEECMAGVGRKGVGWKIWRVPIGVKICKKKVLWKGAIWSDFPRPPICSKAHLRLWGRALMTLQTYTWKMHQGYIGGYWVRHFSVTFH